jgi:hypothetical protein
MQGTVHKGLCAALFLLIGAAAGCPKEEPELSWCEMPPEAACWPDVRDCASEDEVCVHDPETDDPICAPKCFGDFECHAGFECVSVDAPGYCELPGGEYACFEPATASGG